MHVLRPYAPTDLPQLLAVYGTAVRSQCGPFYSSQQVQAWAEHNQPGGELAATIGRGWTLVNPVAEDDSRIAAFAVLDPSDRLALLYCDGRWSRQGRGATLVLALEGEARRRGVQRLRTEASQLSRPLLQRLGWQVDASETVPYAGVLFERWRMIKTLNIAAAPAHG